MVACLLLLYATCNAQNAKINQIQLAGNKLIVHYELDDSNPNNEYQLNLYSSKDNYTVPMTRVSGDVGNEIKAGTGKKIEWQFKEELKEFEGDIALEIRGRVFVMFAKIQDFDIDKAYRRGKTYPLSWKPGNTNPIHIELFKGSERIVGELNHPNNGSYLLTVPSNSKPGDDYRIRISDSKRTGEFIYTDFFNVKPRVPMLVKGLGGLAIIGGAISLLGSTGGGESPGNSGIPLPPDLPTENN
jgi:hypothetical protein